MQADETTGSPLLGRVASDRPTPQQALWQDLELGMFVHFGLVAVTGQFTGITWFADGANPLYCSTLEPVAPGIFDPTDFDAKQWVATARAGGARYLLFTAKHHDGFCLWPTATTPHSVQASPWRGGRGDLVGELAEACRQAGLRCEPPLWRLPLGQAAHRSRLISSLPGHANMALGRRGVQPTRVAGGGRGGGAFPVCMGPACWTLCQ